MGSGPITAEEVAVLVGFAGVAVMIVLSTVVGMRAGDTGPKSTSAKATQAALDADAAEYHAVFAGFVGVFLSLFSVTLLVTLKGHEDAVWRFLAAISGCLHANGTYQLFRQHRHSSAPSLQRTMMLITGCTIATASFLVAAGLFDRSQSFVLFIGILWPIAVGAIAFMSWLALKKEQSVT
jgi:hypothetical protein